MRLSETKTEQKTKLATRQLQVNHTKIQELCNHGFLCTRFSGSVIFLLVVAVFLVVIFFLIVVVLFVVFFKLLLQLRNLLFELADFLGSRKIKNLQMITFKLKVYTHFGHCSIRTSSRFRSSCSSCSPPQIQ